MTRFSNKLAHKIYALLAEHGPLDYAQLAAETLEDPERVLRTIDGLRGQALIRPRPDQRRSDIPVWEQPWGIIRCWEEPYLVSIRSTWAV